MKRIHATSSTHNVNTLHTSCNTLRRTANLNTLHTCYNPLRHTANTRQDIAKERKKERKKRRKEGRGHTESGDMKGISDTHTANTLQTYCNTLRHTVANTLQYFTGKRKKERKTRKA